MNGSQRIIQIRPEVWTEAANPVQTGNEESANVKSAIVTAINALMDTLGAVSFISGAGNLAQALVNFGDSIERSLGCVAVDLVVMASGLQLAAKAFATTDSLLAATFQNLDTQLLFYTAMAAPPLAHPALSTPLSHVGVTAPGSGGVNVGSIFHRVARWIEDEQASVQYTLSSTGIPSPVAAGAAGLVGAVLIVGAVGIGVGALL